MTNAISSHLESSTNNEKRKKVNYTMSTPAHAYSVPTVSICDKCAKGDARAPNYPHYTSKPRFENCWNCSAPLLADSNWMAPLREATTRPPRFGIE